jgi:predicted ABC-class ATPase
VIAEAARFDGMDPDELEDHCAAVEAGASTLLLDEDTSATNFMIRDQRMQTLVHTSQEPITPFVDRIRELRDQLQISTVLVMGGSGDYFDHADTVIQMDAYRPVDVTDRVRSIARNHPTGRLEEYSTELQPRRPRLLSPSTLDPERKPGRVRIQARRRDTLVFGRGEIDLRAVEQLPDASQLRAIGWILVRLWRCGRDPLEPVPSIVETLDRISNGDWDVLTGRPDGDLALPRVHEVMAALNRLRGVEFL